MTAILATEEAETGGLWFEASQGKMSEDPITKTSSMVEYACGHSY
jgi:hypothetical protein